MGRAVGLTAVFRCLFKERRSAQSQEDLLSNDHMNTLHPALFTPLALVERNFSYRLVD
jgi:hypothetical protein